jgi:hypothetical protein
MNFLRKHQFEIVYNKKLLISAVKGAVQKVSKYEFGIEEIFSDTT